MQLPMTGGPAWRVVGAEATFSRGELMRRGAVAAGTVAAFGLVAAGPARGAGGAEPSPIPGGFDENFNIVPKDPFIHVLPPAVGFEMSTITDFRGVVAATELQGTARGSDGSTYAFDADMRFMRGLYVGRDGRLRQGSFGFVWIDLFDGAVGDVTKQVHDFEPGIENSGLFWTIPVSPDSLDADPEAGQARMHASDLHVPDFHDFLNAVSPHPKRRPGRASFDVRWAGGGDTTPVRDETFGFRGTFVDGPATIDFAVQDVNGHGVVYTSDPDGQKTVSAGVGRERNGVFF